MTNISQALPGATQDRTGQVLWLHFCVFLILLACSCFCSVVQEECLAFDLTCSADRLLAFGARPTADLSYAPVPVLIRAQTAGPFTPVLARGKILACSVTPNLPVGLVLSSGDCSISGTPTGASSTTSHVVSADLDLGSRVSASVSIEIYGNFRYLFVTAGDYTGSLGGAPGSDALCNADASRFPVGSTFAAVIGATGGVQRYACFGATPGCSGGGSLNWPLLANTEYRRTDGITVIGSTNVNRVIPLPLTSAIAPSGVAWSGMEGNWNTIGATSECTGWTGIGNGNQWTLIDTSNTGLGNPVCGTPLKLICAEQ